MSIAYLAFHTYILKSVIPGRTIVNSKKSFFYFIQFYLSWIDFCRIMRRFTIYHQKVKSHRNFPWCHFGIRWYHIETLGDINITLKLIFLLGSASVNISIVSQYHTMYTELNVHNCIVRETSQIMYGVHVISLIPLGNSITLSNCSLIQLQSTLIKLDNSPIE